MITWTYNKKDLLEVPEGAEGFVYLITYKDGKKYVGKKSFWSKRRMKVKGKIRKKLIIKESDWKQYRGSSIEGKERAKAGQVASLEILHLCETKGCTMYLELVEMVKRGVLCDPEYINANILLKIYKCYSPMEYEGTK